MSFMCGHCSIEWINFQHIRSVIHFSYPYLMKQLFLNAFPFHKFQFQTFEWQIKSKCNISP